MIPYISLSKMVDSPQTNENNVSRSFLSINSHEKNAGKIFMEKIWKNPTSADVTWTASWFASCVASGLPDTPANAASALGSTSRGSNRSLPPAVQHGPFFVTLVNEPLSELEKP